MADTPYINTNWNQAGDLRSQLQATYGMGAGDADKFTNNFIQSGEGNVNDYISSSGLGSVLAKSPNTGVPAGGVGSYATYTNPQGQVANIDKSAYDAINTGGAIDGTLAKSPDTGFMGTGMTGMQSAQVGLGAIGLGANLYDQFWGTGSKLRKAQLDSLNQQIASNADLINERKATRANIQKHFG